MLIHAIVCIIHSTDKEMKMMVTFPQGFLLESKTLSGKKTLLWCKASLSLYAMLGQINWTSHTVSAVEMLNVCTLSGSHTSQHHSISRYLDNDNAYSNVKFARFSKTGSGIHFMIRWCCSCRRKCRAFSLCTNWNSPSSPM